MNVTPQLQTHEPEPPEVHSPISDSVARKVYERKSELGIANASDFQPTPGEALRREAYDLGFEEQDDEW